MNKGWLSAHDPGIAALVLSACQPCSSGMVFSATPCKLSVADASRASAA